MNTQSQPWYIKLYDQPTYIHFVIWFFFSTLMTFTMFLYFPLGDGNIPLKRLIIGSCIIGTLLGGIITGMITTFKNTQKIYEALSDFENQIKTANELEQLLDLKEQLIAYYRKNIAFRQHGEEASRILAICNTRLTYEFKYKNK